MSRPFFSKKDFPAVRRAIEALSKPQASAILFTQKDAILPMGYKQRPKQELSFIGKPNGLWYSIGSHWLDFVQQEFQTPWRSYKTAIAMEVNKTEVLCINTKEDIEKFEGEYGITEERFNLSLIDWEAVAQKYKGIELSSYSRNFDEISWYNTWDMPSGCVWDTTAITSQRVIYQPALEKGKPTSKVGVNPKPIRGAVIPSM
jgi:hypothetical protein